MLQITAPFQQTSADETPQVPESAVLVVCHSPEEHQISPDILNVSSQTPVPQLLGELIEKGIVRKFYLSVIIERHLRIEALLDTGADITLMSTELLKEVQERTKRTNGTLKLQRCELNLEAYSHTGLQLKHVAPIHLTVGPMDLVHPVYISTLNTYPLLIGKDLLNRLKPLIDFKHLKIWTQVPEPLPCQSLDSNELQCQVTDIAPKSLIDDAVANHDLNRAQTARTLSLGLPRGAAQGQAQGLLRKGFPGLWTDQHPHGVHPNKPKCATHICAPVQDSNSVI